MSSLTKKLLGFGTLIFLAVLLFLYSSSHRLPEIPCPEDVRAIRDLPQALILTPTGHKIHVEIVKTLKERETGMMFRKTVPSGTGMLFVYEGDTAPSIWMKNTWIGLDILWLDRNHRITSIRRNVPPDDPNLDDEQRPVYSGFGEYVLELAAGESERLGLVKGMHLKINRL